MVPLETWGQVSTPQGPLTAVFGVSDAFAVAVGGSGTVITWDGNNWSLIAAPAPVSLDLVWAASPTSVWVASEQLIASWNGNVWQTQEVDGGNFVALFGAPDGVWALNGEGAIVDVEPTSISVRDDDGGNSDSFNNGTWGLSREDIWVSNGELGLVHHNGSLSVLKTPVDPAGVWGLSDGELFVPGFTLQCCDGPTSPGLALLIDGGWDTWVGPGAITTTMGSTWGDCPAEAWAAEVDQTGSPGQTQAHICRWTGSACVPEELPGLPMGMPITSVSGSPHHLWAVANGALYGATK